MLEVQALAIYVIFIWNVAPYGLVVVKISEGFLEGP